MRGEGSDRRRFYRLGAPEIDVYQRGIRHVQLEPVYGGKQDTAVQLRGTCGLALVRVHHPDYLIALAGAARRSRGRLARRIAAQALGYSENPAAQPLLRPAGADRRRGAAGDLRVSAGAAFAVAPDASLEFVAGFLDAGGRPTAPKPRRSRSAAPACRRRLPLPREWVERTFDGNLRRTALLAIAMLKSDAAIAYLLDHVRTRRRRTPSPRSTRWRSTATTRGCAPR